MIAAQLAELIGTEQVSADAEILAAHRFDRWCLKHWQDWQGEPLDAPACVVRPRDSADVQSVVRFAAEHNIPMVPWGLGSGVCGGAPPHTPLPSPQGTIGMLCSAAKRTTDCTSAESRGRTTHAGASNGSPCQSCQCFRHHRSKRCAARISASADTCSVPISSASCAAIIACSLRCRARLKIRSTGAINVVAVPDFYRFSGVIPTQ